MAVEKVLSVQDAFLSYVCKNKTMLTVFLVNGVKLTGEVASFDVFSLLFRREGHSQLVYKHAIATIMPQQPINPSEASADTTSAESEIFVECA
ncbi:MAG: RNA chaperone Hfq [Alphaproteobacteria bacterium]